jgi:hypothetical protein
MTSKVLNKRPRSGEEEFDHTVHICDLTSTLFCKSGYCVTDNDRVVETLLYLSGMDVSEQFETKVVEDGSGYRTKGNEVVTGGVLYTGFKRYDYDEQSCERLLNTPEGVAQLVGILKLEV